MLHHLAGGTAVPVAPGMSAHLALSMALATVVRYARDLPEGSPARRALAHAARPLIDELDRETILDAAVGAPLLNAPNLVVDPVAAAPRFVAA